MVEDIESNYLSGWIKIFRSIRHHWIWNDPVKFQWWIDILLEANHTTKTVAIGYKLFDCERGGCKRSSYFVLNCFFNPIIFCIFGLAVKNNITTTL